MKKNAQRIGERGNVLLYILIAVALLAMLTYAMTRSGRVNEGSMTEERNEIMATDILEYSNALANAAGQLRLRGCTLAELSFENAEVSGYDNASAPSDETCHIFSLSGGAMVYTKAPLEAMDRAASPSLEWHFYGDNVIADVGETCAGASCSDLIAAVDTLSESTCKKLNNLLGVTNPSDAPPTDTDLDTAKFTGTTSYGNTIGDESGGDELATHKAGCFQKTTDPARYVYYKVLHAQ